MSTSQLISSRTGPDPRSDSITLFYLRSQSRMLTTPRRLFVTRSRKYSVRTQTLGELHKPWVSKDLCMLTAPVLKGVYDSCDPLLTRIFLLPGRPSMCLSRNSVQSFIPVLEVKKKLIEQRGSLINRNAGGFYTSWCKQTLNFRSILPPNTSTLFPPIPLQPLISLHHPP